ncbi:MAG TPA: hypothetical protein VJC15_00675 [Candidatus Paceibacterota bacterium]
MVLEVARRRPPSADFGVAKEAVLIWVFELLAVQRVLACTMEGAAAWAELKLVEGQVAWAEREGLWVFAEEARELMFARV